MFRTFVVMTLVAMGLCGSLLGSAAAEDDISMAVLIPRFGPGVVGHVMVGPIGPLCRPNIPCEKPLAGATIQLVGLSKEHPKEVVGTAVTNAFGHFIVSVPAGDYLVQVDVGPVPVCEEEQVTVQGSAFTFVAIDCDSEIR